MNIYIYIYIYIVYTKYKKPFVMFVRFFPREIFDRDGALSSISFLQHIIKITISVSDFTVNYTIYKEAYTIG